MTAPASTDANWSLSPNKTSRADRGTACNTRAISSKSIMEASSITTTSGEVMLFGFADSDSNQRCKVSAASGWACACGSGNRERACNRVCDKRAAALPVGAVNTTRKGNAALACNSCRSLTTVVVFPVPGPPVIKVTAC